MDGDQLSQGYSDTSRRQFTFYHQSSQELLVLIWLICEGLKAKSTIDTPSGSGFLMFAGGIERNQWHKMDQSSEEN